MNGATLDSARADGRPGDSSIGGYAPFSIGHPSSLIVGGTVEQFVVTPEPSTACLVTVGLPAFVAGRKGVLRVGLRAAREAGHDRPTGKG